jgi:hypothetical protein
MLQTWTANQLHCLPGQRGTATDRRVLRLPSMSRHRLPLGGNHNIQCSLRRRSRFQFAWAPARTGLSSLPGAKRHIEFEGVPDGSEQQTEAPGLTHMTLTLINANTLDSSAYSGEEQTMYARRAPRTSIRNSLPHTRDFSSRTSVRGAVALPGNSSRRLYWAAALRDAAADFVLRKSRGARRRDVASGVSVDGRLAFGRRIQSRGSDD